MNSISVGKTAVFADLDALLEFPGELLIAAVGYGLQMDCGRRQMYILQRHPQRYLFKVTTEIPT